MQQEEFRVYAFGFNGFQQIDKESNATIINSSSPKCYNDIRKVLYVGWETTIMIDDEDKLIAMGYVPPWFSRFRIATQGKKLKSIFGDPNVFLGFVDTDNKLSVITKTEEDSKIDILSGIHKAVYCQSLSVILVLDTDGKVQQCKYDNILATIEPVLFLNKVQDMCASKSHVLFKTLSAELPLYGMGSNRLSQLGSDYHELQACSTPTVIDYFCGLNLPTDSISCGPFHSAVVLDKELYTFGWTKDGRLGQGNSKEDDEGDIVSLASFLDSNNQPILPDDDSLSIKQAACGSNHTVAIDELGRVWTCGSNQYGQLGRGIIGDLDYHFKECRLFDFNSEKAIGCYAGNWSTIILSKVLNSE